MELDNKYIGVSLFLLKKIIGRTFPNPPVVSLLVESDKNFKKNKIINFGLTNFGGRPHAEANALKRFNFKKNLYYTLYSTLEPCCHEGREESCVSKILKSKVSRVVYSLKDPDNRVNGMGDYFLKSSGIKVVGGIMKKQTEKIYKGYILNRIFNRPKVVLKVGCSLDSKIAIKANERNNITNSLSKKIVHIIRSESDAILVGSNTVRIDNPKLTCRIDGLKKFSPIRIILSTNLNFLTSSNVFKNCSNYPTIIFTEASKQKISKKFKKKNLKIIEIEKRNFKLSNILFHLAKLNVSNLLVEGGSKIFTSFINENLADEIMIFRSNYFIGSKGKDMIEKIYTTNNTSGSFILKKNFQLGNDSLEILENKNKGKKN